MALKLYLGSSGDGKSYRLYHKMIEGSIADRNREYLVIVPEQFTMQTQKDLVTMHPDHGVMNLDILSFMRLAYRVFDEVGGNDCPVLEDTGKSMLVRKVVQIKQEELKIFGNQVRKPGFISELKSMLSEMFQYSITEEEMGHMIEAASKKPMLCGKLKDILSVYLGFKDLIRERYITQEEILDVLYERIDRCSFIRNSVICFDGFTGFTPSQYKLLSKLMKIAKEVMVTVTIDNREDISREGEEFKLFHLSKKTILKLYKIADENHVEIKEPDKSKGTPYRFLNSESLAFLEHNLFRYPPNVYIGKPSDIKLYVSQNALGEISYTIRTILRLVREQGYRYRDIAIVTGDIALYGRLAEKEFEKACLPVFIDQKKDILSNTLVELLRSLLEMADKNFDYNSVFRYLRCGLTDFKNDEIDKLENYVLAMGIRGFKRWGKPFTKNIRNQAETNLEELNDYRIRFYDSLLPFMEMVSGKERTILDYTKALYCYLEKHSLYEKIDQCREQFEREGLKLKAKEYKQIYTIVLEIFDRLAELLGDEMVSVREYAELLEAGFQEAKVGLIPPGVDQIMIGDIERTRLKDIKVLFFVGVNDGIIPKSGKGGGILSDLDRELLTKENIELAPTRRQSAYTEQFYLYLNLTKPKDKLYISYAKVGDDGKKKNPSYLIGKIKKIFPDIVIDQEREEDKDLYYIMGSDKGYSYWLQGLRQYQDREMSGIWKELLCSFLKQPDFNIEYRKLLDAVFYSGKKQAISKAAAKALYGAELNNSVSRLEKYAECAFAHFLSYGLELKERQEFRVSIPDLGNLFHHSIELFSRKMKEAGWNWHTIQDEERDRLAKEAVAEVTADYGNTVLYSSKRTEYIINRVERMTKRTLWALCHQIRGGEFEPVGYEVQFSPTDNLDTAVMELEDNEVMRLYGRIDRLDSCEDEKNVYIMVVDYKSGSTSFDMEKIYFGLSLQLVVYLEASMEMEQRKYKEKTVIPAGIFYYHIDDPVVEKPSFEASGEQIETALLKELKMDGLSNSNKKILAYIDRSFEQEKSVKSNIIPVELTGKGEFSAYSKVADSKRFHALMTFVKKKVKRFAQEMLDGNTEPSPYRQGTRTACDYCSYQGVCGFDKKLAGYDYRDLFKLDQDRIWEEIDGKDPVDEVPDEGN